MIYVYAIHTIYIDVISPFAINMYTEESFTVMFFKAHFPNSPS